MDRGPDGEVDTDPIQNLEVLVLILKHCPRHVKHPPSPYKLPVFLVALQVLSSIWVVMARNEVNWSLIVDIGVPGLESVNRSLKAIANHLRDTVHPVDVVSIGKLFVTSSVDVGAKEVLLLVEARPGEELGAVVRHAVVKILLWD